MNWNTEIDPGDFPAPPVLLRFGGILGVSQVGSLLMIVVAEVSARADSRNL